jgi:hypothetical protein
MTAEHKPNMAQLKKFRRKLNNAIKRDGTGLGPDALTLQRRNITRNELIQGLNKVMDTGDMNAKVGARKAKKKLSELWLDRDDKGDLSEYLNESGARFAKGKCDADRIAKLNRAKHG